jgi:hypothetical protein
MHLSIGFDKINKIMRKMIKVVFHKFYKNIIAFPSTGFQGSAF